MRTGGLRWWRKADFEKRTGEGTAVAAACKALDVILCEKGFGER